MKILHILSHWLHLNKIKVITQNDELGHIWETTECIKCGATTPIRHIPLKTSGLGCMFSYYRFLDNGVYNFQTTFIGGKGILYVSKADESAEISLDLDMTDINNNNWDSLRGEINHLFERDTLQKNRIAINQPPH